MSSIMQPQRPFELFFCQGLKILLYMLPFTLMLPSAFYEGTVGGICILFVTKMIVFKNGKFLKETWVHWALFMWLGLILRNIYFEAPPASILSSVLWGRFIFLALAVAFCFEDVKFRKFFFLAVLFAVSFVVLDSLKEFFTGTNVWGKTQMFPTRLAGPFKAPKVGVYTLKLAYPLLIASMVFFLRDRSRNLYKIFGYVLPILYILYLFMTGERMPFLLAGFGYVLLFLFSKEMRRPLLKLGAGLLVSIVAAFLFSGKVENKTSQVYRFTEYTYQEFKDLKDTPYQSLINGALNVFKNNPFFGIGLKNYRYVCEDYNGGVESRFPRCGFHVHHIYIEWLVTAGLFGTFSFLCLLFFWGRRAMRSFEVWRSDPISLGYVILLALFLWPIGASQSFFSGWHATLFWLAVGGFLYGSRKTEKNFDERHAEADA